MSMQVFVKRLPHACVMPLPSYATRDSAGLDLQAAIRNPIQIEPGRRRLIPTGLTVSLPHRWCFLILPRSGFALRDGVTVLNAPGLIDEDYRGEIGVVLHNTDIRAPFTVEPGMRIAQAVLAPVVQAKWVEVSALDETARGVGGFGSSGV
jgi:deoxyuridine 5'-triphosphate nucleotidohydrolase